MKKIIAAIVISVGLMVTAKGVAFASDWDKAGKALTIIEGLRVVTGGRVDVIGTLTGINRPGTVVAVNTTYGPVERNDHQGGYDHPRSYGYERPHYRGYRDQQHCSYTKRVWVPNTVWRERYLPAHTEYQPGYGEVFVQAHYERYQVEEGGHWEIIAVYNNH